MTAPDPDKPKKKKKKRRRPKERCVATRHSVEIAGETVDYTATAGTLFLRGDDDEPRASIFYVAYTAEGRGEPSTRPITFAFNGGPGSSAVWLQLGTLGPRRADVMDAGPPGPGGVRLAPNDCSILDVTDLVFIDPVGTGYSRALGETKASAFHSVKTDVSSVAEFIRRYTSRAGRWASPRFIAGESYGTTRAASLAAKLSHEGVMVDGLVMISAALMFQTLVFEVGNDLPYVLYLPAFAATAAYHGALAEAPSDPAWLTEVERFAIEEYGPALALGAALPSERREAMAARLAGLTGLAASLWLERDLRVDLSTFCRELLRKRGQIVGRLDARFTGLLAHPSDDPGEEDPALWYPYGPYTSLMHDYLQRELGYAEERPYQVLSLAVNEAWKWIDEDDKRFGYINAATDLRRAMIQNPSLSVFFGSGRYDLATTYFASMHTARHLGREEPIRAQITEAFYEAGHMMYLHEPSRRKLRDDLVAFYASATG